MDANTATVWVVGLFFTMIVGVSWAVAWRDRGTYVERDKLPDPPLYTWSRGPAEKEEE
jgi:hypothetical protein